MLRFLDLGHIFNALFAIFLIYVLGFLYNYVKYRYRIASYAHFPVMFHQLFDIEGRLARLSFIPRWICPFQRDDIWQQRFSLYQQHQTPLFAICTEKYGRVFTADPDVIKQISTTKRQSFVKLPESRAVDFFGPNIVSTEGEIWKRHRKITAPAFADKTYRTVLESTTRIVLEMFRSWEKHHRSEDEKTLESELRVGIKKDMFHLTLSVLSEAAFGKLLRWEDFSSEKPNGHQLSFHEALRLVISNLNLRLLTPTWLFHVCKWFGIGYLALVQRGFEEFACYLREIVAEKRQALADPNNTSESSKNDVFTHLIAAVGTPENDNRSLYLSDEELYGNLFIYLVAGHETTSNALTFALALLAVYPDVQEKLHDSVTSTIGQRLPTYEDFPKLHYPMYVMKETLRMYPSVAQVFRWAPKAATLDVPLERYKHGGQESCKTVPLVIPANTVLLYHIAAIHRNPQYWPRPDEFLPERFDPTSKIQMQDKKEQPEEGEHSQLPYNRHAFIPFGDGIRSCLGRKFSEVEFVCALTMITQNYTIHLPPDADKSKFLECEFTLTVQLKGPVELILRKRKDAPH